MSEPTVMNAEMRSLDQDRDARFSGFVVVASEEGAEFRLYGPIRRGPESLLHFHDDGETRVALMGRLYYRAEALARAGRASLADGDNDAELAARAYRAHGVEGLERLEGEFALALFDQRNRDLIAMRDPMGGYPVFWLRQGGALILGTAMRPLAEHLPDVALNLDYFGEFMTMPFAENDSLELTPVKGIHRLTSGSILTACNACGPEVRRYWNWSERIDDPGELDVAAIAERYAAMLREATRERLRGTVGAHLSGGMDSTSTALLAARERAKSGEKVHALCLVYEKFSDLAIETPYLESALGEPGIVAHRIAADDILDFDPFAHRPVHDEPFSGFYRCGTDIAMNDVAVARGCHTILTGIGADEVLDTAPFYIADLLKSGHPLKAWREAALWARAFNTTPLRLFRPFGLKPLVPASLQPGLGPFFRNGYAAWERQSALTIAPWVQREFAAQAGIQKRIHARLAYSSRSAGSAVLSDALGRLRQSCGDWVRYHLGAPCGVHIAHPFRDPRVLAFGLGARQRVRPTPSQQKIVLGTAMKDVLPQKILQRFDKGHFNAVYYAGLARNLSMLKKMVADSDVDARGLFDKAMLIRCMKDAALSYRRLDGKVGLDNSLIITQWLSQLSRWRQWRATPSRVAKDYSV